METLYGRESMPTNVVLQDLALVYELIDKGCPQGAENCYTGYG